MTSNKDIEPTHYGTDFSLSRISDNELWNRKLHTNFWKKYVQDNCIKSSPKFRPIYIKGMDEYFTLLNI